MRTHVSPRLRLAAIAGLGMALLACKDPVLEGVEVPPHWGDDIDPAALYINRDVDLLFVIDNSGSMSEEQHALAGAFGAMIEVLERPDVDANYRIAITTTDDGNPWCPDTTPEAGALQLESCMGRLDELLPDDPLFDPAPELCVDTCPEALTVIETLPTAISGDDGLASRDWLERVEGRTNLPEGLTMTQALGCVAPQGILGCGFESPLEAMWKALRRSRTQGDPAQGFVRESAVLSIVHVTDEEDCSSNHDFDSIFLPEGNRVFWSDPAAEAPTSAVCWNAGVLCEGTSPYGDCRSVDLDVEGDVVASADAEDLAVIRPLSRYVGMLQGIEYDKQIITPEQQVLVSIIAGVASDGSVTYEDAAADSVFQGDFGIGPGCVSARGSAVPPVRLRELAEAFETDGRPSMFSVCDEDYSPALAAIAEAIAEQIKPACIPACVADTDPDTPDVLDYACTLTQESPTGMGTFEDVDVPECEADGSVPAGVDGCYVALTGDARSDFCTDAGFNLELRLVRREGVALPEGSAILFDCELSDEKSRDCPELP